MIGILLLVLFMAIFAQMQRTLQQLQEQQSPASSR
jgi:hypothetical protein